MEAGGLQHFFVFLDDDEGKKSEGWGRSVEMERWRHWGRKEEKLGEKEKPDDRREEKKRILN